MFASGSDVCEAAAGGRGGFFVGVDVPGICLTSSRDGSGDCGHLTLTVNLDGVTYTIRTGASDPGWNNTLNATEIDVMLRLLARWWKGKGSDLANFVGRVLAGEEGSNVKTYPILTRDITKTDIGTAYVAVPPGANGERCLVDFTGCTQFRIILNANLIGTGAFAARLVRDSDNTVIFESTNLGAAGERELDTNWQTIPGGISGLTLVRLQAKSATATDDPIFRRCLMLVQ